MIWVLIAILGMFSGFAIHQLYTNYKACKVIRAASPFGLSTVLDGLMRTCNKYAQLLADANRIFGTRTTKNNFAVCTHLIYNLSLIRTVVGSLSMCYLLPGHAVYQVAALDHWLRDVFPVFMISANYSQDSANLPDLCNDENREIIETWRKLAKDVLHDLETINTFLAAGVGQ